MLYMTQRLDPILISIKLHEVTDLMGCTRSFWGKIIKGHNLEAMQGERYNFTCDTSPLPITHCCKIA